MTQFSQKKNYQIAKWKSHQGKKRTDKELVLDYKFALQILNQYKLTTNWEVL